MTRIELSGLIGSHPLGALASFGLLRVLAQIDRSARLLFLERDDFVAAIDTQLESREAIIASLCEHVEARGARVLSAFEEDVRIEPRAYQKKIEDALGGADLELAAFLVALAAPGVVDQSKGLIKPSPFYMASGQQSFIETMKRLREHVRRPELWSEAVFGPWRYQTDEWGAGWDPGTERMHALRFKAPTKDKTSCVAGAVWLGFEALPLFPAFSRRGTATASGWMERDRLDHWRWLLPAVPSSIDVLAILLASADLFESDSAKRRFKREGIAAIYEATRHEFGQGYAVFRPARRVA